MKFICMISIHSGSVSTFNMLIRPGLMGHFLNNRYITIIYTDFVRLAVF